MSSKSIYCTYLTVYLGSKLPMFYIGSTSISKINSNYRGSIQSRKYKSIWKSELRFHPELFKTKILRTFETRDDAFNHEEKLQRFYKVVPSNMFINEAYANKGFTTSGKTHSKETKERMSKARLGKSIAPFSKETREKMSKSRLGKSLPLETRINMSKPRSIEHRINMSKAGKGKPDEIITCPHCNKSGGISAMKRWHLSNCRYIVLHKGN